VRPHPPIFRGYNAVFYVEYTDGSAILRVALPGVNDFAEGKVRVEVAMFRYIDKMTFIPRLRRPALSRLGLGVPTHTKFMSWRAASLVSAILPVVALRVKLLLNYLSTRFIQ
jgi:hypothetical protein